MTPPTRYALVQLPATEEMGDWIRRYRDREIMYTAEEVFANAAATSPNAGRVTAEMLERAAEAVYSRVLYFGKPGWASLSEDGRGGYRADARAAFIGAGIPVADAPAGEVVDG